MQYNIAKHGGEPNNLSKHTDNANSMSAMSGRQATLATLQWLSPIVVLMFVPSCQI